MSGVAGTAFRNGADARACVGCDRRIRDIIALIASALTTPPVLERQPAWLKIVAICPQLAPWFLQPSIVA